MDFKWFDPFFYFLCLFRQLLFRRRYFIGCRDYIIFASHTRTQAAFSNYRPSRKIRERKSKHRRQPNKFTPLFFHIRLRLNKFSVNRIRMELIRKHYLNQGVLMPNVYSSFNIQLKAKSSYSNHSNEKYVYRADSAMCRKIS